MHYVSPCQKANAFAQLYICLPEVGEWGRGNVVNSSLRKAEPSCKANQKFTASEVKATIKSLNPAKAAGTDGLHRRFLHHLGPTALEFMKILFTLYWSTTRIPQGWRVADIRPELKSGKDPQKLDSYRPILSTSVVGKVMERLVANRLRYLAETY